MKEVLIWLFLIISVTSNPIPQCPVCQQNPYSPPSPANQNNPCIQAAMAQNGIPHRDELNQLLMSKIMSNQCVQKILDPKIKLFNHNGEEIQRQNAPNVVNNYFILPPEVFLDKDKKKKKIEKKDDDNNDTVCNIKRKPRTKGRKRKQIKNSSKLIKPVEANKQDENEDSEVKKIKSRRKKNSHSKSKNVKSPEVDSSPILDPIKINEEEFLPPNNKKKRKKNKKPQDDNGVKIKENDNSNRKRILTDDVHKQIANVQEYNNDFQLKNIESPIDNIEVTKDLMENKQLARNPKPDSNWPQNLNSMPEEIFNGFFPYMDMSKYFSPYGNYPFDYGQFYQPNYNKKRKNRRKYDNNNGEPPVLEIKLKPKDSESSDRKINPNTHVLQIKVKPKNKKTEVSTESPTELSYEEIELQLDPTESDVENVDLVTEAPIDVPLNDPIQEYEESLDSIEIMEEDPSNVSPVEESDEKEKSNEEVNIITEIPQEEHIEDTEKFENLEILEEPTTKPDKEEEKAGVKELKIEFEVEELHNNTPELGNEDKVPTMYSNGIINDYYPIFYDDAFYVSEENNYHLKDLDDRLFYETEGQEESFNRDRRKYDKYDYKLPNNIKERLNMRRNFINNIKNEDYNTKYKTKSVEKEDFKMPPLLENPDFVSKKIETKSANLDIYDRPYYVSKYPEKSDTVSNIDMNSSKDIETVFARSKVVKYGAADSRSQEELNEKSDSSSGEPTYVVTARSMGPVEDFYWK